MSSSAEIIQILSDLLNNKTPLSSKTLIPEAFARIVKEDANLFPTIAPIITNILQAPDYYLIDPEIVIVTVLEVLIKSVECEQFLQYYPLPFILQALDSPLSSLNVLAVEVLSRKIESGDNDFLDNNPQVIDKIFLRYFTTSDNDNDSGQLGVLSKIEGLLSQIARLDVNTVKSQLLPKDKLDFLQAIKLRNDILSIRMINFILGLLPKYFKEIPSDLYTWPLEFLQSHDDVLLVAGILEFNKQLLGKIDLDETVPSKVLRTFQDIITLYLDNVATENFQFFTSLLVELICTMARQCMVPPMNEARHQIISFVKEIELCKVSNMRLESTDDFDYQLISSIDANFLQLVNPNFVAEFYGGDFDDFYLKLKVGITLNLLRNESFFDQIKTHLTPEIIKSVPSLDLAYRLITVLSVCPHTYKFLLHSLPSIVVGYLINAPSEISDKEIWSLRVLSLETLLHGFPPRELDGWRNELEESLLLMKYGRNIKNINPSVDIAHETL